MVRHLLWLIGASGVCLAQCIPLCVSANTVTFTTSVGYEVPAQVLGITTTSSGSVGFGVGVGSYSGGEGGWLNPSLACKGCSQGSLSGTIAANSPATMTLGVSNSVTSFPPGSYKTSLTVSSGSTALNVNVTLNVSSLVVPTTVMVFAALAGSPPPTVAQDPQTLTVGTAGSAVAYSFQIEPGAAGSGGLAYCGSSQANAPTPTNVPWMIINQSTTSGAASAPGNLNISVQPASLSPGIYVDYINLVPGGNSPPAVVAAYLAVQGAQSTYNFSYTPGGSMPASQNASFGSQCGVFAANISVAASSDGNWLGVTTNGSGTGLSLVLTATPSATMAAGKYYGTVVVTDAQAEAQVFECILTVTAPSKMLTTTLLSLSANPLSIGQPETLTATVSPAAATGLVTFSDGGNALGNASLSGGRASLPANFAAGTHALMAAYSGDANYAASNSATVNLQVTSAPGATTTALTATPASQTFGSPVNLAATVTPSSATGTVTFTDGTTQIGSAKLSSGVANFATSTLAVGSHTITASYSGDASDAASNSTAVAVNITSSNQPSILAGGIVNAASYAAVNGVGSPVAPGSLVAIFTSQLAAQPAQFSTLTLPPTLGGVSVTFAGYTAPMVTVSPEGTYPYLSVQVPFEALPAGQTSATVPVVITVNGIPSATVQTQMVASQPGIFTLNSEGTGQAVLVNLADYTIAAPTGTTPTSHPIPRGQSAFFYVTGLGAMTPSVADGTGTCPAATGLCNANAMPAVFVGGVQASLVFAGQAPGYPGVAQINLTIPSSVTPGNSVSLVVKSADGTVTSNAGTIAVQ